MTEHARKECINKARGAGRAGAGCTQHLGLQGCPQLVGCSSAGGTPEVRGQLSYPLEQRAEDAFLWLFLICLLPCTFPTPPPVTAVSFRESSRPLQLQCPWLGRHTFITSTSTSSAGEAALAHRQSPSLLSLPLAPPAPPAFPSTCCLLWSPVH